MTKIEWADMTINPVVGCSHCSPGLFHAMTIVANDFPTYMVLTKRPHHAKAVLGDRLLTCPELHRVWLGVTVCNQEEADEKIPLLLQTPAAVRFVSIEPMLGPVTLRRIVSSDMAKGNFLDSLQGTVSLACFGGVSPKCAPALDWVICGGETGPGARPMHPDWVRSLRDQCQSAGVPFFFKSWGEWQPVGWVHAGTKFDHPHIVLTQDGRVVRSREDLAPSHNFALRRVGKRRAGRMLDGREWNEVPEVR